MWTTLAWGSNRVVVLALTLLLARLLTPEDFGLVTAALTIIAMFDAALDLGVGAAVVAAQERGVSRRTRTALTLNIGLSALIAGVGAALSPLVAALFDARDHTWLFALIFLYPLFRGAGQVNDAVLKRDLLFRRRTVVDLTRAGVRVVVSLSLALTVGGPVSIAAGIVASELVAMVLLWSLVPIRPVRSMTRADVRELLGFGGQVTVIRVLGSFRSTFDYLVVGAAISATALGYYGMAYKLPELGIENVLWIFSAVALSAYARARLEGEEALFSAMLRATRLLSLYGLAVGVTLAVLARDAVPVLFSPTWEPAVLPMVLISLSLGLMSVGWASGDVFTALGRPGTLVLLDLPATALMAGLFLLAPRYGLVGVAAVHLVFNAVYCLARLVLLQRVTRVGGRRLLGAVAPGFAVAVPTAAVGFGIQHLLPAGELLSLVVLGLVCAVVVVSVSWLVARSSVLEALHAVLPARAAPAGPSPEATS
ncbi:oligosaccharide flippase family protein [Microlunatus capsulatus]|uniref:PST family polysaccharide transporter n=1 Tax=Microlunatus capsulatus TaxID=99117 RepID=A0ABS4Z4K4_9ACTN|nr:oligosaccharide flippase family protein [Microlunatus capsulatus]MBP2415924.1 PST family polysaccharide transporter [Microlunatus capsulatus]